MPVFRSTSHAFVVASLAFFSPATSDACTLGQWTIESLGPRFVRFIGTVRPDTAPAGPGERSNLAEASRTIYGQLIAVESVALPDRNALPAGTKEVLFVPWGFSVDCSTTLWSGSARWMDPGTRGLFNARLRERRHWRGNVPTFDVTGTRNHPYIGGTLQPGDSLPSLNADELLPLADVMPTSERDARALERDVERFLRWARANPAIAIRQPMRSFVTSYADGVAVRRLISLESPIRGTYRFEISVPGDSLRTFAVRTHANPSSPWPINGAPRTPFAEYPTYTGYYLLAVVARTVAALPPGCAGRRGNEAYLALRLSPTDSTARVRTWRGIIESRFFTRGVPADSLLAALVARLQAEGTRRYALGIPDDETATFIEERGRPVRITAEYLLPDGRRLVVSGERVSMDVSTCVELLTFDRS